MIAGRIAAAPSNIPAYRPAEFHSIQARDLVCQTN